MARFYQCYVCCFSVLISYMQVELYKEKYMNTVKANLIGYTEAKILHSKRTLQNLGKICSELTSIQ